MFVSPRTALAIVSTALLCWTDAAWAAPAGRCTQPLPPDLPELGDRADGLQLSADDAELVRRGESRLSGAVLLSDGQRAFATERLRFHVSRQLVEIDAPSVFRTEDMVVRSSGARFDLVEERGRFEDPEIVLQPIQARAGARALDLDAAGVIALSGARYTTCAPEDRAWELRAGDISLDERSGVGTARHARLHVYGLPLLYVPWFQFPLDDSRRTGFLYPRIGSSSRSGFDLTWPVYINLAPNYDLQVEPRWLSRRGLQLGGEFRYLWQNHRGSLQYAYLANDSREDTDRAFGEFKHRGKLSDRISVRMDYAEVSDTAYFDDFGDDFDRSALTFLPRQLELVYNHPVAYSVSLRASDFQVLDPTLAAAERPFRRLPQVLLDAVTPGSLLFTRAGLNAEYVHFDADNVTTGQRFHVNPYLRAYNDQSSWFAGARLDLQHTSYALSNEPPGTDRSPSRTVPTISAEAGMRFERLTRGGNLQTLEPRGLYLYTPFRDQSDIPVFDSGEPDFDIVQLFATNRFTGTDRIADANHLAGALTSRLLDSRTGDVRWSATIGQLLRVSESRVELRPDEGSADSGATEFIAGFDYRLSQRVSASISTLWSPQDNEFNRVLTRMRYHSGGRLLSAGYRYRRDQLEQTDVAAAWPLGGGLSLIGRWRYSLLDRQSLESLAGVAYESCCWTGRLSFRRFVATSDGDFDTGIFLQFELRGLGGLGGSGGRLVPEEF